MKGPTEEDLYKQIDDAFERLYKKIDAMPSGVTVAQVLVFAIVFSLTILLGLALFT